MIQASLSCQDSFLFICPQCSDCWARLAGTDESFFHHRYVACPQHPEISFAYGSFLAGGLSETDPEILDSLPPDLLTREFYLILTAGDQSE